MCPGGFSGVCRRNMRARVAKWHPYDGCGDMLTAYTCQCSCSRPPEEVPLACSLLENRIQRDFDRLDGDDDTRFLLLLFYRVHVAIEALFAGVALRELVGMGFCACSSYLHHVAPHLYPPAAILRINYQQCHLWIGAHVPPLLSFERRIDEHIGAIVVDPDHAGLGLAVWHHGREDPVDRLDQQIAMGFGHGNGHAALPFHSDMGGSHLDFDRDVACLQQGRDTVPEEPRT